MRDEWKEEKKGTKKEEERKPLSLPLSPRRRRLRLPHDVPLVDGDEPIGGRLLPRRRRSRRRSGRSSRRGRTAPARGRRARADSADGPQRLERRRGDAARGCLAAGERAVVLGDAAAPRGGVRIRGGGRGGGSSRGGRGARRGSSPGEELRRRLRPPRGAQPAEPHRDLARAAQDGKRRARTTRLAH